MERSNSNKIVCIIGPPLTCPLSKKLEVIEEEFYFRIRLSPEVKAKDKSTLSHDFDTEDLVVYHTYTKNSGKKFNPHCWPREERISQNTFLFPAAKTSEEIYYLTACKLRYYWQTCDILREEGVIEFGIFTFPVMVLLAFMRLRQGFTFEMLSALFDYKKLSNLNDIFWQTTIIYFSRCNPIPKLFCDVSADEGEINTYLENLTANYDLLYKRIAGRSCIIIFFNISLRSLKNSFSKQIGFVIL